MIWFWNLLDRAPLWVRVVVTLLVAAYVIESGLRAHPTKWWYIVLGAVLVLFALNEPRRDRNATGKEGDDNAAG